MDHSKDLVWKRSTFVSESEDVWDDRALIDAYDKAVKEVNKRIAEKNVRPNDKRVNSSSIAGNVDKPIDHLWHLGQYCRCVYSEDGIEYEAQIISIDSSADTCSVKYVGYGNEEQKYLKELKPSLGRTHRNIQTQQSETQEVGNNGSDNDCDNKPSRSDRTPNSMDSPEWFLPSGSHFQHVIPPHLPSGLESSLPSDDESLASMLMSWYMSGYHTGYYRALKQCRHLCNK